MRDVSAMTAMVLFGTMMLVAGDAAAPVVMEPRIAMAAESRTEVAADARIETADGPPVSGESLYRRLCASCHGVAGRGDGRVSAALCPRPTDLTRLRSPMPELTRQIDGRRTIRAHGTAQTPVWGEMLAPSLISDARRRRAAMLKVDAIADYVMRLRRPAPTADSPRSR